MILIEHGLLEPTAVASSAKQVWAERDATRPPTVLAPLPPSWPGRYVRIAADNDLQTPSFLDAVELVEAVGRDVPPAAGSP